MKLKDLLNCLNKDLCRYGQYYQNDMPLIKKGFFAFIFFFKFSGFRAVCLYRLSNYSFVNRKILLYHFIEFSKIFLVSIHIDSQTVIKGGLQIPYASCIVVGGGFIGENCSIYPGVTIGVRKKDDSFAIIDDNVSIYSGAKILGEVRIGNNVKIGANAVVINDIPNDATAVGIPAQFINNKNNSYL